MVDEEEPKDYGAPWEPTGLRRRRVGDVASGFRMKDVLKDDPPSMSGGRFPSLDLSSNVEAVQGIMADMHEQQEAARRELEEKEAAERQEREDERAEARRQHDQMLRWTIASVVVGIVAAIAAVVAIVIAVAPAAPAPEPSVTSTPAAADVETPMLTEDHRGFDVFSLSVARAASAAAIPAFTWDR